MFKVVTQPVIGNGWLFKLDSLTFRKISDKYFIENS